MLAVSCGESESERQKRVHAEKVQRILAADREWRQQYQGADIAAQYYAPPSRNYIKEADDELQAFVDQERRAYNASQDAADIADAVDQANYDAQTRHRQQMDAIESARREAAEERERLEREEHFRRFQERGR